MTDPAKKPIPLTLDWASPEGKAHMIAMAKLFPSDPVAMAHAENLEGEDLATFKKLQAAVEAKRRAPKDEDADLAALLET